MHDERALVDLSRRQCVVLLAGAKVGRAVFTERALPAILPVTFVVHDDAVVMATSAGTRLAAAVQHGVLAFEADQIDLDTRTGWSVVVTGLPEIVADPQERARIEAVLSPWVPGTHDIYIRLPLTVVTGRCLETAVAPAAGA